MALRPLHPRRPCVVDCSLPSFCLMSSFSCARWFSAQGCVVRSSAGSRRHARAGKGCRAYVWLQWQGWVRHMGAHNQVGRGGGEKRDNKIRLARVESISRSRKTASNASIHKRRNDKCCFAMSGGRAADDAAAPHKRSFRISGGQSCFEEQMHAAHERCTVLPLWMFACRLRA